MIPFAVRLFELVDGVAKADDVFRWALVEVIDLERAAGRSGDALTVFSGEGGAVGHPEIAGAAFGDLELDGAWPDFLFALDVVEDAAVAGLAFAGA